MLVFSNSLSLSAIERIDYLDLSLSEVFGKMTLRGVVEVTKLIIPES